MLAQGSRRGFASNADYFPSVPRNLRPPKRNLSPHVTCLWLVSSVHAVCLESAHGLIIIGVAGTSSDSNLPLSVCPSRRRHTILVAATSAYAMALSPYEQIQVCAHDICTLLLHDKVPRFHLLLLFHVSLPTRCP